MNPENFDPLLDKIFAEWAQDAASIALRHRLGHCAPPVTKKVPAIDQSSSSLKIFPLART